MSHSIHIYVTESLIKVHKKFRFGKQKVYKKFINCLQKVHKAFAEQKFDPTPVDPGPRSIIFEFYVEDAGSRLMKRAARLIMESFRRYDYTQRRRRTPATAS